MQILSTAFNTDYLNAEARGWFRTGIVTGKLDIVATPLLPSRDS